MDKAPHDEQQTNEIRKTFITTYINEKLTETNTEKKVPQCFRTMTSLLSPSPALFP